MEPNSTFSMWHVHGLASVLKTSVTSIYPEFNIRYRSIFNQECHLRNSPATKNKLYIMWTRASPCPERSWTPNHFVPCCDFKAILQQQKGYFVTATNFFGQ